MLLVVRLMLLVVRLVIRLILLVVRLMLLVVRLVLRLMLLVVRLMLLVVRLVVRLLLVVRLILGLLMLRLFLHLINKNVSYLYSSIYSWITTRYAEVRAQWVIFKKILPIAVILHSCYKVLSGARLSHQWWTAWWIRFCKLRFATKSTYATITAWSILKIRIKATRIKS